jgi:hypothetical protein
MKRALGEYDTFINIMSNYNEDKIEDCLHEAF